MGNSLCCLSTSEVGLDDPWLKEGVFGKTLVDLHDDEFSQFEDQRSHLKPSMVQRILQADKNTWNDLQKRNNQMPWYKDFLSEPEYISEPNVGDSEGDVGYKIGGQIDSDRDGSTEETISAHDNFISSDEEEIKEEIKQTMNDEANIKHRNDSSQINLQVQTLNVTAAGTSAVNGVYRWFTAHGRFVMFTDKGHYQIMGGVNLCELYGERYNYCWVIEEITENMVCLYAAASDLGISIPSDGWICINGSSPSPNVQEGDEREVYEEGYTESEDCDASLSLMPTCYMTKQSVANNPEGFDVEWVA